MSGCGALPGWFCEFPALPRATLAGVRRAVDGGFRDWIADWGAVIDAITAPLQAILLGLEGAFTDAPWLPAWLAMLALVQAAGRDARLTLGAGAALLAVGWVGLWQDMMTTLAMVSVATILAILIGLPIGILAARNNRAQAAILPVLDLMQTLPSFVYLIPVVMVFGIGRLPGLLAVTVYAVPPLIRLTNLGMRSVPTSLRRAAEGLGATPGQRLRRVDLPLALPAIMAGVNQTIMMALAMVVVASMVGVGGLGRNVLQAINNQFFTAGALNGLALVALAMIFDRTAAAIARRFRHEGPQAQR